MHRESQPRDQATRFLVVVNIGIFLLQSASGHNWGPIEQVFALSGAGLRHGEFWQLVTYQFLHANVVHILVNMLALWFAGRELEPLIGTPRFVILYLVGGIVGGLAQIAFSPGPLIGASGSVCAVLLALTTLLPNMPVLALILFVLPLRMRARTLGYLLVAITLLTWLSGWMPDVGHLAHVGGLAAGAVFGVIYRGRFEEPADLADPEFVALEGDVPTSLLTEDDVLAKMMRRGFESLTREERRILEARPSRHRP